MLFLLPLWLMSLLIKWKRAIYWQKLQNQARHRAEWAPLSVSAKKSSKQLKCMMSAVSDVSSTWLNWIHPQWAPSIKFPKAPRHCLLLTCIFTLCRFDPIYPWNYICIIYFQPLYTELSSAWVDFIIVFWDQSSPEELTWDMFQFECNLTFKI